MLGLYFSPCPFTRLNVMPETPPNPNPPVIALSICRLHIVVSCRIAPAFNESGSNLHVFVSGWLEAASPVSLLL